MTQTYKLVDLEEGTPVQYLGVYALKWRPEMGEPSVGFVEVEDEELRWIPISERLPQPGEDVIIKTSTGISTTTYEENWGWCYEPPTHWMYPPRFPEEVK